MESKVLPKPSRAVVPHHRAVEQPPKNQNQNLQSFILKNDQFISVISWLLEPANAQMAIEQPPSPHPPTQNKFYPKIQIENVSKIFFLVVVFFDHQT